MSCRVYLANKIGNLKAKDISINVNFAIELCRSFGMEPINVWKQYDEKLYANEELVVASKEDLLTMAKRDKKAVASCHVLVWIDAEEQSKGAELEAWYMRYHLMRPVIFVDNSSYMSLRSADGDYIATSVYQALRYARKNYYTWWQRFIWRLKIVYNPISILKRVTNFIQGWR